jgi:hypothetical protein
MATVHPMQSNMRYCSFGGAYHPSSSRWSSFRENPLRILSSMGPKLKSMRVVDVMRPRCTRRNPKKLLADLQSNNEVQIEEGVLKKSVSGKWPRNYLDSTLRRS